ncbi:MAG: lytic murein transglycosylase [Desulfobacterales bacterium]|nr:MAG: lytic murein transglycosylase [Desulfobacterales bacterium]
MVLKRRTGIRLGIVWGCWAILALMLPSQASAGEKNNFDYFGALQKRLMKDGFTPQEIQSLYGRPEVVFEAKGISFFFTYREATLNYDQFATPESIRSARIYMEEYQADLDRTENTYGVDKQIITAILLVETRLGKSLGKRSAFSALSTLAALMDAKVRSEFWNTALKSKKVSRKYFEKKAAARSRWAYKELKALLKYAAEEELDPVAMRGSVAGAVGLAQFMPSNIVKYAEDGNQDGTVDLLNPADAFASIANYLKNHGWRPGLNRAKAGEVIYRYNHSDYYVNTVLRIAELLKG